MYMHIGTRAAIRMQTMFNYSLCNSLIHYALDSVVPMQMASPANAHQANWAAQSLPSLPARHFALHHIAEQFVASCCAPSVPVDTTFSFVMQRTIHLVILADICSARQPPAPPHPSTPTQPRPLTAPLRSCYFQPYLISAYLCQNWIPVQTFAPELCNLRTSIKRLPQFWNRVMKHTPEVDSSAYRHCTT